MTIVPSLEFLINARLVNHPVMGGAMRLSGFLRNDAPLGMIRSGGKTLAAGSNLLIFPEGTRTKSPPLDPFHHGHALVAVRSGAPVRTVFITCDSDYFGRNFSFFSTGRAPVRYRVTAGKAFVVSREDDPRAISAETERYMRGILEGNSEPSPGA
jgi:1-acyl-sn-glycerol-3-phosphate acyltransferase